MDPPVVPHVIHSLRRGQIAVCVLPKSGRETGGKKKHRESSTWGEGMDIFSFHSLFASSSPCCLGETFISLAFLFLRVGEVHDECKKF